ncbi:MAG TPA: chorismate mutase [Gaiellaceae bacterium]
MTETTPAVDPVISSFRDEIVALDVRLLGIVNARIQAVGKLRRYKQQRGIEFLDPAREVWLAQYLKRVNAGPLSEGGLTELHRFVLDLVKRELDR